MGVLSIFGDPLPVAQPWIDPLPGQRSLEFDRWNWDRKKCRTCDTEEFTITPAGEFQCDFCRRGKKPMANSKTATATKKPKASKKPPETPGELLGAEPVETKTADAQPSRIDTLAAMGNSRDLPIPQIRIVPNLNPREVFDESDMSSLQNSIEQHGLLQPIIVRPSEEVPYDWDLIAGERRFLTCRDRLGLTTIWAKICQTDDEIQAAITDDENGQRVQLNPIEQAKSMQMRWKASGLKQSAFATKIGITQAHVSNTLRLLDLPPEIRDYVISKEISPAVARVFLTYLDIPVMASEITEWLADRRKKLPAGETITGNDVATFLVIAVQKYGRPLDGQWWDTSKHKFIDLTGFRDRVTFQQIKLLKVRDCPTHSGTPVSLAFNIDLWKDIQAQREAEDAASIERIDQAAAEAELPDGVGDADSFQRPLDKAMDGLPVEQRDAIKELSAEMRARDYRRDLEEYALWWHQVMIAASIPETDNDFRLRLMLHFCQTSVGERGSRTVNRNVLHSHGMLLGEDKQSERPELLYTLSECREQKLNTIATELLQAWAMLEADEYGVNGLTPYLIERLAIELGINYADHWRPTGDFLQFHSDEQLKELAKEWKLKKLPADRDDLINFITEQPNLKVPARLLAIKLVPDLPIEEPS
jgi:ParB family chromosome partitioning protein